MNTGQITSADMEYPAIGTCGEPIDLLCVTIYRCRAITPIYIGFDGVRGGWVLIGLFLDGPSPEYREVGFVSEDLMAP